MSSPRKILDGCASALHQAELKPLGYRKSGFTWTLSGEWTKIINLQLSQWNSAEEIQFTLNFGVFAPELQRILGGPGQVGTIKEYDCVIRTRYGSLTPSRLDHWWKVDAATEPDALTAELRAALITYGLPWLASFTDYDAVASHFDGKNDDFRAGLAYHLAGKEDLAIGRIRSSIQSADPHFKPKALRIARHLNLIGREDPEAG